MAEKYTLDHEYGFTVLVKGPNPEQALQALRSALKGRSYMMRIQNDDQKPT